MQKLSEEALRTIAAWLFLAFVLVMAFDMLLDPGTGDVPIFIWKMNIAVQSGIRAAFASPVAQEYPPLASALLLLPHYIITTFGLTELLGLKLAIFLFYLVAIAIFYALSRDIVLTVAFALAFVINAMHMGYLDIWCAPFLFIALWLMSSDKPAAGFFFYALACLVKWQPIIIAPFLFIYAFQTRGFAQVVGLLRRRDFWQSSAVLLVIILACALIFGPSLTDSLDHAARNSRYNLAPNGLNVPLLSGIIYRQLADPAGLLPSIRDGIKLDEHLWVFLAFRALFVITYTATFLTALAIGNDRNRVLLCAVTAFWSYVMLSTGVHENHLAVGVILAFFMASRDRSLWLPAIVTAAMFNFNLLLFYFSNSFIKFSDAPYIAGVIPAVLAFIWMVAFCWNKAEQQPSARFSTLYEGVPDALRSSRQLFSRYL